jgi:hypothetical protein
LVSLQAGLRETSFWRHALPKHRRFGFKPDMKNQQDPAMLKSERLMEMKR